MQAPLVGAVGQEYVHSVLTSMNPQNAVREIQKNSAFRNKRCRPVLELLDQLGLKRCSPLRNDPMSIAIELLLNSNA